MIHLEFGKGDGGRLGGYTQAPGEHRPRCPLLERHTAIKTKPPPHTPPGGPNTRLLFRGLAHRVGTSATSLPVFAKAPGTSASADSNRGGGKTKT